MTAPGGPTAPPGVMRTSQGALQGRLLRLAALWAACGLLGSTMGCRDQGDPPPRERTRPNVLLVVLDTARADFFSCYGHPRPTTPRIDRLAAEGIRYQRAYATDFWTLPSHASLLTGLYPTEAGATSETNHLPGKVVTLAERLRNNGYQTGAVVCNAWISRERGFAQGFSDFAEMWRQEKVPSGKAPGSRYEQGAVDRAVEWIEGHASSSSPFFLFVNFNTAHLPYAPPPDVRERFASRHWPLRRVRRLMTVAGMWAHLAGATKLDETDFQIMRELYEAELAVVDDHVGKLVDVLTRRSLLDDTVVVITSDHGENIGDHGMIDHLLSMYESTLHIPLIIRYPKFFRAGTVRDNLVSLVDMVPTLLEVCDLPDEWPPGQGNHLSLCGQNDPHPEFVVAENGRPVNAVRLLRSRYPAFDVSTIDHRMQMIRTREHRLIRRGNGSVELFDLRSDPGELQDLAAVHPEIRDRLLAALENWMAGVESGPAPRLLEGEDEESRRRLRSLGYID